MSSTSKCSRTPTFSRYHPVIPKIYTPAWKLDMSNRNRIVENCHLAELPYRGSEATLYLEKRERLNNAEPRDLVMSKSMKVPRERLLQPWFHSPLSKYQSSLMFRTAAS